MLRGSGLICELKDGVGGGEGLQRRRCVLLRKFAALQFFYLHSLLPITWTLWVEDFGSSWKAIWLVVWIGKHLRSYTRHRLGELIGWSLFHVHSSSVIVA